MNAIGLWLDPFLSLLYPPRCVVCQALGTPTCLCGDCAQAILPVAEPRCSRCGLAVGGPGPCYHCRERVPAFARARALGAYEGVLRAAIHRFKYRDRPQLAEPLGALLADYARLHSRSLHDLRFDSLVAVPMHPIRQRLRGYNQSERLARAVSGHLALPLLTKALIRTRPTRPQVGLAGDARRRNLHAAFAVARPEDVAGKTFLLIDDVTTTGSTLHECASALRAADAQAVYALTLAAG